MVGMPVFIDQGDVRVRMEEKGIGLGVSKSASADAIHAAVVRVRDDPAFRASVRALSSLMRKRRHHPMADAAWLIEFLAETRGAPHLRPASRHLNAAQYLCLDVLAVLVVALVAAWKASRWLCRACATKKGKKAKTA